MIDGVISFGPFVCQPFEEYVCSDKLTLQAMRYHKIETSKDEATVVLEDVYTYGNTIKVYKLRHTA